MFLQGSGDDTRKTGTSARMLRTSYVAKIYDLQDYKIHLKGLKIQLGE